MTMRKLFKTVIATAMAVAMTVSLSNGMTVKAAENNDIEDLKVEYVDSFDGIVEKGLHIVSAEELMHEFDMQQTMILPDIAVLDEYCIGDFQSSRVDGISTYSSENSITQKFSGTIEEEGGISYLLVTLAPGEILQSTLSGPVDENINYDLLLYTYNNGLDTCVSASTLTTHINTYSDGTTKTVEDGVSYVNNGDENQTYALIVYGTTGYSLTETFTLTVSIDEEGYYDASEPNDSPFTATTISTGAKITGCGLNVANDQDWFVWNVPSTVSGVSLALDNSDYVAEVYYASGTSMVLVNAYNGIYNLNSGYYYIRVYNTSDSFVSSDYTLTLQPYGNTASTIKVTFNGDMGSSKVSYPEGSYYRFEDTLTPSVLVLDSSGYPVISKTVTLTWLSGSWNESTGNSTRSQSMTTDSNGKASFSLTVPTSLGYNSCLLTGAITFRHYYDIDGIVFTCGSASSSQIVYHFAYSTYVSS